MLFFVAHGCPNCGGEVSDERLSLGLPCERCLPDGNVDPCTLKNLKGLKPFCKVSEELPWFFRAFNAVVGRPPSSLQLTWAKRLLMGESFAIVAPTGTGKTTFGLLALLFFSPKSLALVPTRLLCEQFAERLSQANDKLGTHKRILAYRGRKSERREFEEGNFDILVCTSAFMYQNVETFAKFNFRLVFVDDVDSFLKNSRHVDSLFKVLGFSEDEIALALKRNKTREDYERLFEVRQRFRGARLIISSATLRPRTNRLALFQNLLGFDVQRAVSTLRNVKDAFESVPEERLFSRTLELIRELGRGGLVFLSEDRGREGVEDLKEFLSAKGIKVISYLDETPERLRELISKGEFDVALGLSHLGNPLVRGVDFPEVLRYAIFVGVPKHLFPVTLEESPSRLLVLLSALLPLFEGEEHLRALSYLRYLRNYSGLRAEDLPRYPRIAQRIGEIKEFLETKLQDEAFKERLRNSKEVALKEENGRLFVVVGDAASYIQASGRVSRLSAGGVLPGLSVVLVEDERAFTSLKRRLEFFTGEPVEFVPLSSLNLKEESERLTVARRLLVGADAVSIKSTLVVVESPHKARTIASFWGRPSSRRIGRLTVYEIPVENRLLLVTASLGHVFNLSRRRGIFGVYALNGTFVPVFDTIKRCASTGEELVDPEEVKERCPEQEVFDKAEILSALARLSFSVDEVFIGSDPDAEGEKIAYDLYITLRPFQKNIKRLEFHEVTSRALREALSRPQEFHIFRVKAQLARRVADRWVGFTLSRFLWRVFSKRGLSAGRVQTPVLGWVIERAKEASKRRHILSFFLGGTRFSVEVESRKKANELLKALDELEFRILETHEEELKAPPPFTTDSVLEEAYERLRFSSRKTMELLQQLFESGLITYHRTDSTRVSEVGRFQVARPYIEERFGREVFVPRGWSEGGAHEAIRPTRPWDAAELRSRIAHGLLHLDDERDALRLYDLIFRRFMASQMKNARVRRGVIEFRLKDLSWKDSAVLEVVEPGFTQIWGHIEVFSLEGARPEGGSVQSVSAVPLFTEGSLVQEMKRRGLGRPSTYAEIVTTLLSRGYIKPISGGRLVPTHLGRQVYEVLRERFPHYVSEEFTRELEELMDRVESGIAEWNEVCFRLKELVSGEAL